MAKNHISFSKIAFHDTFILLGEAVLFVELTWEKTSTILWQPTLYLVFQTPNKASQHTIIIQYFDS